MACLRMVHFAPVAPGMIVATCHELFIAHAAPYYCGGAEEDIGAPGTIFHDLAGHKVSICSHRADARFLVAMDAAEFIRLLGEISVSVRLASTRRRLR